MRIIVKMAFFFLIYHCLSTTSYAQKVVMGSIKDKQSDEAIPFVAITFKNASSGVLADSSGNFTISISNVLSTDSLIVNAIGYKIVAIALSSIPAKEVITIKLEVLPPQKEAIVKSSYNRANWFWRKIIKNKPLNDRTRWDSYSYEIYNKLELDLNNIQKKKVGSIRLLKPLNFVLDFVDSTSEEKPYLPVYLTETISDYHFQKNPRRVREEIKASKTNGLDNESLVKQLGGTYQNVNVYSNTIAVFDRQFISPFSDNGISFYNFKLLDTQYLQKKRLVHFRFTPKHKGQDVFEGDCWVHDTSFAIQKVTLRPSVEANINFITDLTLIQEYKLINDSTWFLYKDKFVADISPLGNKTVSFKGRKTTTYKNVIINNTKTTEALKKSKLAEDILVLTPPDSQADSFWLSSRHEALNKNEQTVYKVLDTLTKNATYIRYRNTLNFLTTGTKDIGNIRVGPWWYWVSANVWEGVRTRFDLSTNYGFSKKWKICGYAAYGFKDQKMKGKAEVKYQIGRQPWSYVSASWRKDLDNGQMYYDQIGTDNIFAVAFRRANIPIKFQQLEERKLEYYTETNKGFAFGLTLNNSLYNPLANLPDKILFPTPIGEPLNDFRATLRLKFAYLERTIEDNFIRTSLGSDFPIIDVKIGRGIANVLQSGYSYTRIDATVSDYLKIAPYGSLYYNFFGGKVNSTLPYQLLEVVPGNEMYYYNRYSFNLMNRFEYITDSYIGFNVEHNIGNGLFRFTPLTRKLKFRQFWSAKGITGSLTTANKKMNFVGNYPFKDLSNKWYIELGTGVDNIFKLFRIDFIWRVAAPNAQPVANIPERSNFGVFGSFKIGF